MAVQRCVSIDQRFPECVELGLMDFAWCCAQSDSEAEVLRGVVQGGCDFAFASPLQLAL
jgi:hypothetical protein